jgi:hypothetical protein
MYKPYANTYQLISLLDNGAFEYLGDPVPFWSIIGAGLDSTGNKYSISEEPGPVYRAIRLELSESDPVTLVQSFKSDTFGPMDFPVPLHDGLRDAIPEGYQNTERKVLAHKRSFTLAFDINFEAGAALTELVVEPTGSSILTSPDDIEFEGVTSQNISAKRWTRVVFKFKYDYSIGKIGLRFTRTSTEDHTVVKLTKIALFNGSYDAAPYTGDLMARSFPKGAIILWQGKACPPGFEDIGEGDGTPKDSWVEAQPDIKARKGNYPRASEQAGEVQHTAPDVFIKPGNSSVALFEEFESKFIQIKKKGAAPAIDTSGSTGVVDVPDEYGNPSHNHELETADTRPASVGFMFCQRL